MARGPCGRLRRDDHSSSPGLATGIERPTRGFVSPLSLRRVKRSTFVCTKGAQRAGPALPSYLVLHLAGFAMPPMLPPGRWALTPPFHPCLRPNHTTSRRFSSGLSPGCTRRRFVLCGTFRDAAVSGRIPWRYQARCPHRLRGFGVRTFLPPGPCGTQPAIVELTRHFHYTVTLCESDQLRARRVLEREAQLKLRFSS